MTSELAVTQPLVQRGSDADQIVPMPGDEIPVIPAAHQQRGQATAVDRRGRSASGRRRLAAGGALGLEQIVEGEPDVGPGGDVGGVLGGTEPQPVVQDAVE